MQWYIGCSGFHYKEWKELFYPKGLPQRLWLNYYYQHFNTLELNVTFYRVPQLYYSAYDQNFLQQVTTAIKNAKQAKQAFIYFNNTAQTAAIQNAQYVQHLVMQ